MKDFFMLIPVQDLTPVFLFIRLSNAVIANILLAYGAFRKNAVSLSGAAAGILLGFGIYLGGGLSAWFVLGAFFVSSSMLSRLSNSRKEALERIHDKGNTRDGWQAAANAAPASLWMLCFAFTSHPLFAAGFLGSLACAASDTWASEIGVLASGSPRSIVSGQPVEPGQSGAVSLPGLLASLGGAVAMLIAAFPFILMIPGESLIRGLVWGGIISGVAGSVVDSMLGATIQAQYQDSKGAYTEKRYETLFTKRSGGIRMATRLVRGQRWITNDVVNVMSNGISSLTAMVLFAIIS